MSERNPIHTIGHSTRTIPEFVDLLRVGNVELVVDIRSVPRSRASPQFNLDALPGALASRQIGYRHIQELGGLRGKSKTIPPEVNGYWTHPSFHNYADYALSEAFREGLSTLLHLSEIKRSAIMCSEAVWWRCHRSMIADYLKARGFQVYHILSTTKVQVHPCLLYTSDAADE